MNHNLQKTHRLAIVSNRGVTLMEVIFAIGVILTGLVGIAALIPLAANNARETLELDQSISESTSAAAVGRAQSFNDLSTLVIFDKPAAGSTTRVTGTFGYFPENGIRTIRSKLVPSPPLLLPFEKLESPGYGHMPFSSGLTSAICIDPLGLPELRLADQFVGAPTSTTPFIAVNATDGAFDYSRFPYYGERYNVLLPPNQAIGTPGGPSAPAPTTMPWPMSPRMWRATLRSPLHGVGVGGTPLMTANQLMPGAALRSIFTGSAGVSSFSFENTDDPKSVLISRTGVYDASNNFQFVDASRDASSSYGWFATLTPPVLGGNTFRLSIVVVRQRQAPVPIRQNDPLALQKDAYTISSPDDNPAAERVTWVGDAIGFNGGAGGEVQIYGSQAVSDEITAGQWVLLSRQPHTLGPIVPVGAAVHRWYRVQRVDDAEQVSGYAWPGGTADVWRRWISLAGPDWAFQDEGQPPSPPVNTTPIDDTFCTIVTGAVSVIESEVVIE